jgi:hypothetical protein
MLVAVIAPPTHRLSPIPTPPVTVNAPVLVPVLGVLLVIEIATFVELPLLVTVCSVLVVHTVTAPVDVLIAVSVPAVSLVTANVLIVAVVNI